MTLTEKNNAFSKKDIHVHNNTHFYTLIKTYTRPVAYGNHIL